MVAEGTSSSCRAGGAAGSLSCSNNVLLPSLGTSETFSCRASASSPASTDASETALTTSPTESAIDNTTTGTPSATSEPTFSVSIGGAAGGVIGGLLGLAAIGLGIFFFMRRRKLKNLYHPPTTGYAPPTEHQNPLASPAPSYGTPYGGFEAKPAGVADGGYYPPTAYPQGPYDPHMSILAPSRPWQATA
ncbi:hypothetical protein BU23DRAFT_145192 [Bimuria novae-zelandiae CBS 107.79]|uniref:Epidermal growth factor receptor-like transmembrane-juxtamembrane segment domain-containing protein n=1 Tax=Bimuria novae-zelandiae CBS 107.79 TaxID=1447943 RepID=A0A6A5VA59_9PLEO|nr:hypothetical protein BU23DRAFT_145192 [Bimuria novae-zelandiae CBS 107.79]